MKQDDIHLGKQILGKIHEIAKEIPEEITLMHVCGTHEYTIAKNGIRGLMPENVKIIPGPGCPVCVCPTSDIDLAIELSKRKDIILTTFGDMLRVPSSTTSLYEAKAQGADIRVVYGPHDAVELARKNPDKEVVFFSIGFETTVPLPAVELANNPPKNFSLISVQKLVPPAMDVLLNLEDVNIQGFLLPGHVCTIIGSNIFKPYAEKYHSPMVVGGFEANHVLISLYYLLRQIKNNEAKVENTYQSVARDEGNIEAQKYMYKVFEPCNAIWRGIGNIPDSGLKIKDELQQYDAVKKFNIKVQTNAKMPPGCSCDKVLIGKIFPHQCPLFGTKCTPRSPVGPCMVSHEGSCKIAYMFKDID